MRKNAIKMEFDRLYASAVMKMAQGNDELARNYLRGAAGKLSSLLVLADEDEKEAIQTWLMDIGVELEKLRIRIENEKTKPKVLEALGVSSEKKESERKPFMVNVPKVTFDEVAGMDKVKDTIRDKVIYPRLYPQLFQTFKKKAGGGILLYGLPGTGKTMVAKAIAK